MAFTSASIAPLMPDISMKLPEQAMMKLVDMEGAAHEKNTNSLAKLIEMSQVGLSKITDPEVRKRVEQSLAPMQAKIDDLSNTLVKNPGEFAYMTNYLNSVGLDLAKNFTNGPAGNTIRLFDDIEKRKSEWMKNDPVQAERVFNTSNPYIQEQIKIAEQGGSPTLPSYMKQPNMVDKTRHYLQGVLRDKRGMSNFKIQDDGTIIKEDNTILAYDAQLKNDLRDALESDPDIINYYNSMGKIDPSYSGKQVIRTNKLGQKVYYGRGKNNETTDEKNAFSKLDYDINNALGVINMYTRDNVQSDINISPLGAPDNKISDDDSGKNKKTEKITDITIGSSNLEKDSTEEPKSFTQLESDLTAKRKTLETAQQRYNSIANNPNIEQTARNNALTELHTAKYDYENSKREIENIRTYSWNTTPLSKEERDIYRKYTSTRDLNNLEEQLRIARISATNRDPKTVSRYKELQKEYDTFNKASKLYNNNIATNLNKWYSRNDKTEIGQSALRKKNIISLENQKDLNLKAQDIIGVNSGEFKFINLNTGKAATYDEVKAASEGMENWISTASYNTNNMAYDTKPLTNGAKYRIQTKSGSPVRGELLKELVKPNYSMNARVLAQSELDPDNKRVLDVAAKTKFALDDNVDSGPERNISIGEGLEVSLKKTKNGYIKLKIYDPNNPSIKLTSADKSSGDNEYISIPPSENMEQVLMNAVQLAKQQKQLLKK